MNQAFSKIWILIILIIFIVGGISAWQYFGASEEKTQLNIDQIKNAEIYSDVFKEKVQLVDDRYERRYPEGASELYVVTSDDNIVFSDLDNDGIKEVTVITYWSGGGSGTWRELTILKNKIGHPFFITSKDLGDRTIINSLIIESGVITLDMVVHGPDDAMCCPTLKKVAKYKLVGTELVEILNETADWETYRNEEYGFELKYPKDWKHWSEPLTEGFSKNFTKDDNEFLCEFYANGVLTDNFDSYMENYYTKPTTLTTIDIDGTSVIKAGQFPYFCSYWIKREDGGKFSVQITQVIHKIITSEEGYKVQYGYVDDPQCLNVFNQMLSTFRFLE